MLFQPLRPSKPLQVSLQAAIASHRPVALKIMFDHHGEHVFANALAGLSQRAAADALSMLPADDRGRLQPHLPKTLRNTLSCLRQPSRCRSDSGIHHARISNASVLSCATTLPL